MIEYHLISNAKMRNSMQRTCLERDAGWCEASGEFCRTHRGAVAVNITVGANGNSRDRVKMWWHLKGIPMG